MSESDAAYQQGYTRGEKRGYEHAVREVVAAIRREHDRYSAGAYTSGIKHAIEIAARLLSAPAEPPADDWCKCPIKTKGKITLTYHPIGGHAAPLLDGFRCQHCNRRVEAFHKAAPSTRPRLPPRCASGSCGDSPMAERSTERRADTPPSLAEAQTKRRVPVGCASCPSASSP